MKMPYIYKSVFAPEFQSYFALRESQGHQHKRESCYFIKLDEYLVAENITKKTLTASVIEGWLRSLPGEMSVNTKIVYISHYGQFAKYLNTLGISAFIPERPIDDNSYMPHVFTEDEINRLFVFADRLETLSPNHKSVFASRDIPMILRILYGCGLRVSEALRLRINDANLSSGVLFIRNAKGDKDRLVPMEKSLIPILGSYIFRFCGDVPKDRLIFVNHKGGQYSTTAILNWFNKTLEATGIEKPELPKYARNICTHCLRHTFAVHSFRKQDLAGVDMYAAEPFLSTYMGHARLYGTETYLHMTGESSGDVINKTTAYATGLFPKVPL